MSTAFSPVVLGRTLADLGGRPGAASDLVADLELRHAEPHRRYHTAEHVAEVVAEAHRLWQLAPDDVPEDTVTIAAMFHDAVYDVHGAAGASEAASADLAVDQLVAAGAAPGSPLLDELHRLIVLTAGHQVVPGDDAGALLIDADLWVLSSPPERYARYVGAVRGEYAHVTDELWRTGRTAVLQHFLDQADALYGFGPESDRTARRARARANLQGELNDLT